MIMSVPSFKWHFFNVLCPWVRYTSVLSNFILRFGEGESESFTSLTLVHWVCRSTQHALPWSPGTDLVWLGEVLWARKSWRSYDGDQMCLDSSVVRVPARIAVGPRFDSSFGHFVLFRSVIKRSRCWSDGECETFTSLTHTCLSL